MSEDCIGCNPDHTTGHLCLSCKAALETGRIFQKLFNENPRVTIKERAGKVVIMFPDSSGSSGDTLKEAFELSGGRLSE